MPRLLLRLLAGLSALALGASSAAAAPALWRVQGPAGGTVWLFGTVHVLHPSTVWRSPRVAAAFAASDDLWLEVESPDPATLAPLTARLGLDPAHPLSTRVTAGDVARLDAAAKAAGLAGEAQLEAMRPWLAALTLSLAPIRQAGFDPNSGVDRVLDAEAHGAGKPVHPFETAEQQLRLFADLPPALELALLTESLKDADEGPAELETLVAAWARGDVAVIERLEDQELRRDAPALYRTLIVDRNRAWAVQLAERLRRGGMSFVAVGAGHLVGPDGVPGLLRAQGFKVERVESSVERRPTPAVGPGG